MNYLKICRKPKLVISLALSFLIFSCSQYELKESRSFNYSIFKIFKEQNIKLIDIDLKSYNNRISLEEGQDLIAILNNEYGSDLVIPDHVLDALLTKTDIDDIKSFVVNEGLLSNQDVESLISFVNKTEVDNFNIAIDEFEQNIISRNLSSVEFEKYDNIASSIKIVNDENPEIFSNYKSVNRGIWACLGAYVVWVAALIGFVTGCATIFLCAVATIGLTAATIDVVASCAPDN